LQGLFYCLLHELMEFLQKGAAPVYVGFGSIGDPALADQTTKLVMDALKRSGQRGVLATGWSGISKIDHLPEEFFMLESVPHSWLFPRMAAVVHHGGAGTTAAGLRLSSQAAMINLRGEGAFMILAQARNPFREKNSQRKNYRMR
jgi:sterol 3beta-glucosyltransferase